MTALLVALGGALGTLLRYATNVVCSERFGAAWPIATFGVNTSGSFVLALLAQWLGPRTLAGVPLSLVLGTGVLGGFTTYSSFNLEAFRMLERGEVGRALIYMGSTLVSCLALAAVGWQLGTKLASP